MSASALRQTRWAADVVPIQRLEEHVSVSALAVGVQRLQVTGVCNPAQISHDSFKTSQQQQEQ